MIAHYVYREPVENFCPPKQTEPVTVKTNYYRLTTKVDGTINFVYTTDMQRIVTGKQ